MGKSSTILCLLFMITLGVNAQERVSLTSFGHPIEAAIRDDQLTWSFVEETSAPQGVVDWRGAAPTRLRDLQAVILPDGTPGLAVLGLRAGREGLFLLQPVWGGARLWGDDGWLSAGAGESVLGYQWSRSTSGSTLAALWSLQRLYVQSGDSVQGYRSDSVSWGTARRAVVRVLPWDVARAPGWAVAAATQQADGWVPSIWTWNRGLMLQARGEASAALGDADVAMNVMPSQQGPSTIALNQGATYVTWSWANYGARAPFVTSLNSPPSGTSFGSRGAPAFFWWSNGAQVTGSAAMQWGDVAAQNWSLDLPGSLTWSSEVYSRTDGWRVWLLVNISGISSLYRLDVSVKGFASLEKAGALPARFASPALRYEASGWSLTGADSSQKWILEPEVPRLTPVTTSTTRLQE